MPIENVRSILIIGLCVVLFLLWQAWQRDYGLKRPITEPAPTTTTAPDAPSVQAPEQPTGAEAPVAAPDTPGTVTPVVKGDRVRIQTDLLTLEMDQTGKQIFSLELLDYPVAVEQPDVPFRLFLDTPGDIFTAETGLLGSGEQPNAESRFVPAQTDYVMEDGQDKLEVRFNWAGDTGIKVRKVYTFTRDSYEVPITYEVENTSDEPWSGRVYGQFRRKPPVPEGGLFRTYTYTGGVLSSPEKPYEKIDFDDMLEKPLDKSYPGGWMAMIQHYFAAAFVPNKDATANYYTKALARGAVPDRRVRRPGRAAGRDRGAHAHRLCRTEDPKTPGGGRPRVGTHRRLRVALLYRPAAVLALELDTRGHRQLGLVDHRADLLDQARLLPPLGDQLQVHGADAQAHPAHAAATRTLWQRQAAHEPGADGALQEREGQPARRLFAHRGPDTRIHLALLGVARKRGAAPGVVDPLVQRSVTITTPSSCCRS